MTNTTYEVTGSTPFLGHQPGETFDAELAPDVERRALERGSIKKTTAKKKEDGDG